MSKEIVQNVDETAVANQINRLAPQIVKGRRRLSQKTVSEVNNLLREMVTKGMLLTIKVASCDCPRREQCQVYKYAREIVQVLDKLQGIRAR